MLKALGIYFGIICALSLLNGCDPLTVHKVTSTIFDGVPSMPPAEQYCQDYHERKLVEDMEAAKKKQTAAKSAAGSSHPPYDEKRCSDCHDQTKDLGLIKPKDELCFVCHPDIINKYFVHGPAAVGGCLECHEPHSTAFPALLKVDKKEVCALCHKEQRLARGMHDKVAAQGLLCTDCHDPHAGAAKYFLR
jgi:predicted CXXCH cytochrome family protein